MFNKHIHITTLVSILSVQYLIFIELFLSVLTCLTHKKIGLCDKVRILFNLLFLLLEKC